MSQIIISRELNCIHKYAKILSLLNMAADHVCEIGNINNKEGEQSCIKSHCKMFSGTSNSTYHVK